MKYIKKFENKDSLKKYILISIKDDILSIIEIFNSYTNENDELIYQFRSLYRIDEDGFRKLPNKLKFKIRYNSIIKSMISQSDSIEELIEQMQLIYNSKKYNL